MQTVNAEVKHQPVYRDTLSPPEIRFILRPVSSSELGDSLVYRFTVHYPIGNDSVTSVIPTTSYKVYKHKYCVSQDKYDSDIFLWKAGFVSLLIVACAVVSILGRKLKANDRA